MERVDLFGHLGQDPETRVTPSGKKVTNFSVAVNSRANGKDITRWWRVTVWGEMPILQYFKKGSAIMVFGHLSRAETYVDKNGETKMALEVTADRLEFPPFGRDRQQQEEQQQQQGGMTPQPQAQQHSQPAQGFGEQTYASPQQPQSQPAQVSEGQGSSYGVQEDEPLPF